MHIISDFNTLTDRVIRLVLTAEKAGDEVFLKAMHDMIYSGGVRMTVEFEDRKLHWIPDGPGQEIEDESSN